MAGYTTKQDTEDRKRQLLQWFRTDHMAEYLRPLVEAYRKLAEEVIATTASNAEQTLAIRFLEQSKDYAVRALVLKQEEKTNGQ